MYNIVAVGLKFMDSGDIGMRSNLVHGWATLGSDKIQPTFFTGANFITGDSSWWKGSITWSKVDPIISLEKKTFIFNQSVSMA